MIVAYWRMIILAFTLSQVLASVASAPCTSDDGQLSVYGPVPGLPQSPFYTLQVRAVNGPSRSFHSFKDLCEPNRLSITIFKDKRPKFTSTCLA